MTFIFRTIFFLSLFLLLGNSARTQLCAGSLGDPVVHITFGSGANPGQALGNNNYVFYNQDCPNDGQYTIRNNTMGCFGNTWHGLSSDHTGDRNGYFMLVNASFQPGDFYREKVGGLCGNTTYEFAAWVLNVLRPTACGGSGIKPNLTFSIETPGGAVLATYNTEDIYSEVQPKWKQYGMFFTTPAGLSEVVVRLRNNAPGGCGNDLALDDITFRPCGAKIEASIDGFPEGKVEPCEGVDATYRFSAKVTSAYIEPEVQWQESMDSGLTWKNIQGATAHTYTWTPRPAARYLYRLVVAEKGNISSAACRIASLPLQIRVHPLPKITINKVLPLCSGAVFNLDASIDFQDTKAGTFKWDIPPGTNMGFSQKDSGTVLLLHGSQQMNASYAGLYQLQATSAAGCRATDSVRVSLLDMPSANFQLPPTACSGKALTLTGTGTVNNGSIARWQWTWGRSSTADTKDIAPVFDTAGTYPISLSVQAENGCSSDTITKMIIVYPKPVPSFLLPEVCLADAFAQFQNTSRIVAEEGLSYRWTFGDPANTNFFSTEKDPRYRYGTTGVYPVVLSVTSASGCSADTTRMFTVNGSFPKAICTLENTGVLCSADSIMLRNEATVDFGKITKVVIRWKNDDDPGAVTKDENPFFGKRYAFSYRPLVDAVNKKFVIRFTVYSGISCVSEITKEINITKSPQVSLASLPSVCANSVPYQLTQGSEQTGISGKAVYIGNGVTASGEFSPVLAGPGVHGVQYRYTSAEGCSAVAAQPLQVFPVPRISAGPDRTVLAGGAIKLQATASGNGLRFAWTPITSMNDPTVLQPVVTPRSDLVYRLTAISSDGCTVSDDVVVKVAPSLYIPNAFTPNGDGINDYWQVPYLESLTGADVQVFNRYGQMIFQTDGTRKWDGRWNGAELPSGAYIYLVNLNGKISKGVVMLIR